MSSRYRAVLFPFPSHSRMGALRMRRLRWSLPPAAVLLGGGWSYLNAQSSQSRRFVDRGHQSAFLSSSAALGSSDQSRKQIQGAPKSKAHDAASKAAQSNLSVWNMVVQKLEGVKDSVTPPEWSGIGDNIKNYIIPDWARYLPATLQKLQRELSMAPGSLAHEIWKESHDEDINPEIKREARVRVGNNLCSEEETFRQRRQKHVIKALAAYLDIPEHEIHPDDVPVIAMCGSGGGLRALVAGTGSYLAAQEAGLWDCVTYTAGVSGSCWLQALYHSSIGGHNFNRLMDHLKNRLGVHLAFPPKALNLLTTAPTHKFLLTGLVEKMKGDPSAEVGLVDIYGLLLAARLLVPKGELAVCDTDLKLSNQRFGLADGAQPLPIYTAVRHEIPVLGPPRKSKDQLTPERLIEQSKEEAWFQWFEFTPYEFFCEELNAGIPTWALGRHFHGGQNVVPADHHRLPELRIPLLLGIWGSAFCATLSHYYKEIRPLMRGIAGFGGIDQLIEGKSKDLVRVHPIDPAAIPNFVLGMKDQLPPSCPASIFQSEHLRLMDAGMSNNLPIYPLVRPERGVDIIVAFDASADIKQENWLAIVDGYARQRGIKGWPIGAGWPRKDSSAAETQEALREAQEASEETAHKHLEAAQHADPPRGGQEKHTPQERPAAEESDPSTDTDLGYCNVWVGTKQEMTSDEEPPPSKRLFHPRDADHSDSDFHLMKPDAGIAVVYFPLLPNPSAPDLPPSSTLSKQRVPSGTSPTSTSGNVTDSSQPVAPHPSSINPDVDDFLSTWNFVYTPEQIDSVVGLAKANFAQGEEQVKRVVRGVYERKKSDRLRREKQARDAQPWFEDRGNWGRMEGLI